MTQQAKNLISDLLQGYYFLPWKRPSGAKCFRLYDTNGNPVRNIRPSTVNKVDKHIDPEIKIFKVEKKYGKITISRSMVRKLHGNHGIKRMLKNQISNNAKAKQPIITEPVTASGQFLIPFR
jgi:hypothetical protein